MTDGLVASGDDALLRTLFELLVTEENPELVSDGRFDVRDETVRVMVRERVEEGLMEQSTAESAEDVNGEGASEFGCVPVEIRDVDAPANAMRDHDRLERVRWQQLFGKWHEKTQGNFRVAHIIIALLYVQLTGSGIKCLTATAGQVLERRPPRRPIRVVDNIC